MLMYTIKYLVVELLKLSCGFIAKLVYDERRRRFSENYEVDHLSSGIVGTYLFQWNRQPCSCGMGHPIPVEN